jgi:hypothetical protein
MGFFPHVACFFRQEGQTEKFENEHAKQSVARFERVKSYREQVEVASLSLAYSLRRNRAH